MSKKTTKVICPNCGQEIAIADHEHFAAGIAIGKDSGLGTVVLPPADGKENPPVNKAEARLQALRAAGVDTSGLFSLKGAAGEGLLVRMGSDGAPEVVKDDDPIFNGILAAGTVPERRLFRRWVMAQMFRMLQNNRGFTEALHFKGYDYQWRQTIEELRVQNVLAKKDPENFIMRNRFFNKKTVIAMAEDYLRKLTVAVNYLPEKHYKRQGYKRIGGRNVLLVDIPALLNEVTGYIRDIRKANNPGTLYTRTKKFYENIPVLRDMRHSNDWTDAYKGAGAYFTLRNLIMFHGCALHPFGDLDPADRQMQSLAMLDNLAEKYSTGRNGYRLLGLLKETLDDNGIDIDAKRREWAEQKAARRAATATAR